MSFVLDITRDEVAAKIAARENATSLAASSQVASIASGLRLAETGTRSTHFAELLQRSTMASLAGRFGDVSDQGVKTAGFFVLLGAEMPSVLFRRPSSRIRRKSVWQRPTTARSSPTES
jgi:N-acetylmuramoyl-L-alanine amidase